MVYEVVLLIRYIDDKIYLRCTRFAFEITYFIFYYN